MQLFIEGQEVDVNESFSTLLTASIDDVKNFGSKETTFSKTIILPGTKNNNRIFGNIFNTTTRSPYDPAQPNSGYNFNAAVSAKVLVLNQSIQQLKGTLRLLQINVDGGFIDFEVSVIGELGGFVSKLGANRLEDLDFSSYDHVWSTSIASSWNNAGGSGYVYPLIDYGNVGLSTANVLGGKTNWTQNAFKPALYAREYIDKIFAAAGYTYECDLFNSTRFKNLIVPFNRAKMTFKTNNLVDGVRYDAYNVVDKFSSSNEVVCQQSNTIYPLFTTTDKGTYTYVGEQTISFKLIWAMSFAINMPYSSGKFINFNLYINNTLITTQTKTSGSTFTWASTGYNITLAKNDTVSLRIESNMTLTRTDPYYIRYQSGAFKIQSTIAQDVEYLGDETIQMNGILPKNVLQKDFITSILKLFNLYVYEDIFKEKHLIIKPYVDFFTVEIEDWSAKVDRSKPMAIKPMSELNARYYQFSYKDDADYYNDQYKKRYAESYGSLKYDSGFEFANETAKVELIFSPTPLVGYVGEQKTFSTIFKRSGNAAPYTEERIDSNLRLLQYKKMTGVSAWVLRNTANSSNIGTYTDYPYAGHLDNPNTPTDDLNYGAPQELYFPLAAGSLSTNQFNLYYSSYMAEITDKDSKLMSCTIRLSKRDWYNLSFAKFKWIDGSLWRLNKVTDYNASSEDTCKAEFLKVIEKTY